MQVYLHILVFNKCIQCTCNCTWLNIREIAIVFFWSPLQCWEWSGGAMVLGKLPVPGRPTYSDKSRARAYCA